MDAMQEKRVAISKIDNGKYLAQCRLCGRWIEVHPAIGQDMTIKFWEADFTCCETNQALFSSPSELLKRSQDLPQAGAS